MNSLTRSQKIENLDLLLNLVIGDAEKLAMSKQESFSVVTQYTSLIGPNITITTPQYTGVITVDFEGSVVRFDTYGFRHRFADNNAFLTFFMKTLESPLHACHKLAGEIGGKTMGNNVILQKENVAYFITEIPGGFEMKFSNQKIMSSFDDIVGLLGA
jgi:hypothetical protein